MIRKCDCVDDWMDARYGRQMRVMNPAKGKVPGTAIARCCTCGKEYVIPKEAAK